MSSFYRRVRPFCRSYRSEERESPSQNPTRSASRHSRYFRIEFSFSCFYKHPHTLSANFSALLQIYSPLSPYSTSIAAVGAFAIESANVVGYAGQTLNDGLTTSVGTFVSVSASDSIPISALTPSATGLASEAIFLQTLDEFGAMANSYIWITDAEAGDYGLEGAGWLDADTYSLADKVFTPGEGYLIQNAYADGKVTCAGAVAKGATEIILNDGLTASGNLNPATVNIQSIVATATGIASEAIFIQTLDEYGAMAKTYIYITEAEAGDYGLEGAGWIDADDYSLADKDFVPGEGCLVQNAYPDGKVILPAVLVD